MRAENHFKLSQAKHIRQLEIDHLSKQCKFDSEQLHGLKQKKDRLRLKTNRNQKDYIRSQVQKQKNFTNFERVQNIMESSV
jgi:hypothetical protein